MVNVDLKIAQNIAIVDTYTLELLKCLDRGFQSESEFGQYTQRINRFVEVALAKFAIGGDYVEVRRGLEGIVPHLLKAFDYAKQGERVSQGYDRLSLYDLFTCYSFVALASVLNDEQCSYLFSNTYYGTHGGSMKVLGSESAIVRAIRNYHLGKTDEAIAETEMILSGRMMRPSLTPAIGASKILWHSLLMALINKDGDSLKASCRKLDKWFKQYADKFFLTENGYAICMMLNFPLMYFMRQGSLRENIIQPFDSQFIDWNLLSEPELGQMKKTSLIK